MNEKILQVQAQPWSRQSWGRDQTSILRNPDLSLVITLEMCIFISCYMTPGSWVLSSTAYFFAFNGNLICEFWSFFFSFMLSLRFYLGHIVSKYGEKKRNKPWDLIHWLFHPASMSVLDAAACVSPDLFQVCRLAFHSCANQLHLWHIRTYVPALSEEFKYKNINATKAVYL